MARNQTHGTLGVISFGLAVGLTWAIAVVMLAITAGLFGWGAKIAAVLQNLYLGYSPNVVGAVAGAVWAFVHAFVLGMLVAWFYNRFLLVRRRHFGPEPAHVHGRHSHEAGERGGGEEPEREQRKAAPGRGRVRPPHGQ